jgi:hypothetical protein
MMKLSSIFAGALVAMALTACGSDSGSGSCTMTSTGTSGVSGCVEFSGPMINASNVQQACTPGNCGSASCTYSSSGCATSNRIGRCAVSFNQSGSSFSATTSFYGDGSNASSLKTACESQNGVQTGVTASWTSG